MSRSYKKVPTVSDQGRGAAFQKRLANKRVRKDWTIQNGRSYRKVSCSYDICDWANHYWSLAYIHAKAARRQWGEGEAEKLWRSARMK